MHKAHSDRRSRWKTAVALAVALACGGCQTTRSWQDDCPGVYSGVRYYNSQIASVPWDGKIFFALDLPLTAVFDTLLLPASAFVDRKRPQGGWVPGCKWAE